MWVAWFCSHPFWFPHSRLPLWSPQELKNRRQCMRRSFEGYVFLKYIYIYIIIADFRWFTGFFWCDSVSWRSFAITHRSNEAWTVVPHIQRIHCFSIREGPGRCPVCWGTAEVSGGIHMFNHACYQVPRVYGWVNWLPHCGCCENTWWYVSKYTSLINC